MAETSVNHLVSFINQQIEAREILNSCLVKAEALANVALSDDFLDYSTSIMHDYLWVLSDLIEKAKKLNEDSISLLLKEPNK